MTSTLDNHHVLNLKDLIQVIIATIPRNFELTINLWGSNSNSTKINLLIHKPQQNPKTRRKDAPQNPLLKSKQASKANQIRLK